MEDFLLLKKQYLEIHLIRLYNLYNYQDIFRHFPLPDIQCRVWCIYMKQSFAEIKLLCSSLTSIICYGYENWVITYFLTHSFVFINVFIIHNCTWKLSAKHEVKRLIVVILHPSNKYACLHLSISNWTVQNQWTVKDNTLLIDR